MNDPSDTEEFGVNLDLLQFTQDRRLFDNPK